MTAAAAAATPVVESSAGQRAAEQAVSDAHARVEAADRDAADADTTRDELLDRLRAGDTTVTANDLANADVPIAAAAIRAADLSAVLAEAGAYARSGAPAKVKTAVSEARKAKDSPDQLTAVYTRAVLDIGTRPRPLGAPRVPAGSDRPRWVGADLNVQGFNIAGAHHADWQDHRNGGAQ